MDRECVIQGRIIGTAGVAGIQQILAENPAFSRYKLSRALCERWNGRDPKAQIKDMGSATLKAWVSGKSAATFIASEKPSIQRWDSFCSIGRFRSLTLAHW